MLEIHGKRDCPFAWRVRLVARQKGVDFEWLPYDVVIAQYLDEGRDGRRLMPESARDRARARVLLATVVPKLEVAPSHAKSREAAIRKVREGHAALDRTLSDGRRFLGGDST